MPRVYTWSGSEPSRRNLTLADLRAAKGRRSARDRQDRGRGTGTFCGFPSPRGDRCRTGRVGAHCGRGPCGNCETVHISSEELEKFRTGLNELSCCAQRDET